MRGCKWFSGIVAAVVALQGKKDGDSRNVAVSRRRFRFLDIVLGSRIECENPIFGGCCCCE